ncbi:MAG: ferredoxin--NADP reductase [Bacteroidales bacterium]
MEKPDTYKKTVVEALQQLTKDSFLLSFRRTFEFLPGQVIALTLAPGEDPRYYSIANGNSEESIEILFNIKPGGSITPRLAGLKPGDTLYHSLPSGCFLSSPQSAIWIAAGTGIAPFRSMLKSGITPAFQFIQGGRTPEDLYFREYFSGIFTDKYYPCCSRKNQEGMFYGRVTQFLEGNTEIYNDKLYYICGSAEMVVDSREMLLKKGVSYGNILAEIYF